MELEKASIWNRNDLKSSQSPPVENSILVNGHKPIVNPLYDDDEFDVDTDTPFLAALSTTELTKLDKSVVVGENECHNQTIEDGEILENSNDGTASNERKERRSTSRSSKNDEKSKRMKKSRSRKSKQFSPERRPSCVRFRGGHERSNSYVDRDKNGRKTADKSKTRESTNRDEFVAERERRHRRDSRNRKSDSIKRDESTSRRRETTPRDTSVVPPTINRNIRYTKCLPLIAYAENGRYPPIGTDKAKRTEPIANACAANAKPDAESSKSRKFETKSEEKRSKRSRYRSRSKTKSKSPIAKAPKCLVEKKSSDSVANATSNEDNKDESKNRSESKQSDRLEWKDVQRKSTAANDLPIAIVDDNQAQSHEEFHTIPLNLNISKQKHHSENRTREKSLEKPATAECQLEDVQQDEKFETRRNKEPDDVIKSAKSAKNSKRKNEPMNASFYDEYDEFLLLVEPSLKENGHVEEESMEDTKNSIHTTDDKDRKSDTTVKVELQNIKSEPSPLVPKTDDIDPPSLATLPNNKCAIEPIEMPTRIKIELTLQTPTEAGTNSRSIVKSPSTNVRAEEYANESASKIDKSSTESGGESNRKSREKLSLSKRKRSTSSSSSSSTTSSDSSSSSSSSDDDSSSSSSSDSSSSSSDSETSSNSSSSGKERRESIGTTTATTAISKPIQTVSAFVGQETKMQEKNFEEFASKALHSYGFNLDEELLNGTNELLSEVESFKQIMEKRKAEQKNATKSNGSERASEQSTATDDTVIGDPNRTSILLKLNKPSVASVSAEKIFDSELEHGGDKRSGKSNSLCVGSAKEDTSDDSRRSSHRNRGAARKSREDNERSRRRSADRHRKRPNDDQKKSSTHHSRKSSRHRSRSPHSSKYAASRNRDRRSSSRSRKTSRERHDSIDRGSKRSRNRIERFDRNERKSSFTPPPRRRSTSRNRSLASPIESRRRSLSPGRPYKQNMSPPPSWHRYERRSPFMCTCSPNQCNCVHRNGDQFSRNAAAAARGPRTPPNTPPSESNALYDRYGDRGDVRAYAEHRSPSELNNFAGCDQNIHIRLSLPPPSSSLYHQSPIIGLPSGDGDYGSGYNHSPQYAQNHFPFHSAPIHPPQSNPGLNHSHAPVLGSGDGYYYQTIFPPVVMMPNIEQSHLMQSHRSFAPYVSQPAYGNSPMNAMQTKRPPMRKPERKSTIVQKGNVLEIVPGLELQQDAASEANTDPVPKTQLPPMSDEQILQMERLKRKKERQQKRMAKEKRKEFVINEIKRLSQRFIVNEDGKMIKAGELLKTSCFGKYVNGSPRPDTNANDSNDTATSPPPVQLYDYDANAKVGKSIIVSVDSSNRDSTTYRKKSVVFADGILPGEGTSASENNSDGDEFSTKKAIARSKNKKRNARNTASSICSNDVNGAIDKENSDEKKMALKSEVTSRNEEADENYVPGPPDGSPTPHLRQPKLKCPEKFIVNQLMYFHYNQYDHSMYVSPFPNPAHQPPPTAKHMQSAIPTVITTQPTYAYNKHKVQMDSPKDVKVVSRTPLSVQQKPFHSADSNLIVLQSNSPTINYTTNDSTANNYGTSPYMSHGHQQASPQQPIPTHYTSQSPIQTYRTHTPIVTHQTYQMATPTQNYMQSPQIVNNHYPTII